VARSDDGMIRICEPEIGDAERKYVLEALDEVELSGHGRHVALFEKRLAEYIGVNHAVLVPNGTIALHLSLAAMGIGPGDYVVLPSQTIAVCLFSVIQQGAIPIIIDVDPDTWVMGTELSRAMDWIQDDAKGAQGKKCVFMPVHIFAGIPCDMNYIRAAQQALSDGVPLVDVRVLEDCSEAFGSLYNVRNSKDPRWCRVGSIGDAGTFSFFANKTVACGEGGAITTDSDILNQQLRYKRNCAYGKDPVMKFLADDLGFNYRPSNFIACMGLGQLDHVDQLCQRRLELNHWYKQMLSAEFTVQQVPGNCDPVPWMTAILVPRKHGVSQRDHLMQYLSENGIETRPTFPPLGDHGLIKKLNIFTVNLGETVSRRIWEDGVILPSGGSHLTLSRINYICDTVNAFLR